MPRKSIAYNATLCKDSTFTRLQNPTQEEWTNLFYVVQQIVGKQGKISNQNHRQSSRNLAHDTTSHNRGYSQSNTINLASNHIECNIHKP